MTGQDDEPGYEQARDELARVVATLEQGGLGLEDSLALWERGEAPRPALRAAPRGGAGTGRGRPRRGRPRRRRAGRRRVTPFG